MGRSKKGESKPGGGSLKDATVAAKKPCRTCGRELTPDPKQLAAGNEVETCSNSCQVFKIGKRTNQAIMKQMRVDEILKVAEGDLEQIDEQPSSRNTYRAAARRQLALIAGGNVQQDDLPPEERLTKIDVDAWIELIILDVAVEHKKGPTNAPLPTCEDVEDGLQSVLRAEAKLSAENQHEEKSSDTSAPSRSSSLTSTAISGPGLRERVRRSARRLFILPASKWACSSKISAEDTGLPTIDVLQNNQVVDGLAGVSFAKGTMQFRLTSR
ncbi:unnamed protein product [Sympodiomycopsis kandeliae]